MIRPVLLLLFPLVILIAQPVNQIITDEISEKPILIGECNRRAFEDTNFVRWFDSEYEEYEPDESIMELIEEYKTDITITIIMGTWCGDSRREVPRFYKILDQLDFPDQSVHLIAVNRDKIIPGVDISELDIQLVPTFIFYGENTELGRIIEVPEETLEKDFLKIIR